MSSSMACQLNAHTSVLAAAAAMQLGGLGTCVPWLVGPLSIRTALSTEPAFVKSDWPQRVDRRALNCQSFGWRRNYSQARSGSAPSWLTLFKLSRAYFFQGKTPSRPVTKSIDMRIRLARRFFLDDRHASGPNASTESSDCYDLIVHSRESLVGRSICSSVAGQEIRNICLATAC